MPTSLPFVKCHGCGNDFLVIAAGEWERGGLRPETAVPALCDRHTGVGADGVILWEPLPGGPGAVRFRIFNQDGSEAEMSGNGLRCLAAHLFLDHPEAAGTGSAGAGAGSVLRVETLAGSRTVTLLERVPGACRLRLDLGPAAFEPGAVPVRLPDGVMDTRRFTLDLGGVPVTLTALSTGNPHASVRVEAFDDAFIAFAGPRLENHPAFPSRANVEFLRVVDTHTLEVRFWERGVGPTRSSGTGSAAAAAAALANGWVSSPVQVRMEGGEFVVRREPDGRLLQDGWAHRVFRGEIER
ncbi:MAG: diaminopimelate epimerase [Acidobacteria bacterium]|nr:diaminopimelate epimerase [Acidobacteriota bacterium]